MTAVTPSAQRDRTLAVGRRLLDAGSLDTVWRDVYLGRARELTAALLSVEEYELLKRREREAEQQLRQIRLAMEEQDWARVKDLSARVAVLRQAIDARRAELEFADALFGAARTVPFDPFSPGHEAMCAARRVTPAEARTALVEALRQLERDDAPRAAFYAGRRRHFEALDVGAPAGEGAAATSDLQELERQALLAMEAGAIDRLQQLADEILRIRGGNAGGPGAAGSSTQARHRCPVDLSAPLGPEVVQRARGLGLAVETLPAAGENVGPIVDFMYANAYNPSFHDDLSQLEGSVRLRAVISGCQLPGPLAGALQEFVELFMRHPYVNSGGARYLPAICKEVVLFEDFPEDAEPPARSPLLEALRLPGRRALSRLAIEEALLRYGAEVLRGGLGLDPVEFRLVCIPLDVYARLGPAQKWGRQPRWTHFDGYQVMRDLSVRALVGGDVRYGGLVDLVSISVDDARENVVARFAVIRRARLVARWR